MTAAVAPLLAVLSMLGFQVGAAISVPLLVTLGPSATTWLRLLGATATSWAVATPRLRRHSLRPLGSAVLLGAVTSGMSLCYAEAIARIPLGMATAIEFLGPLGVAVLASRHLTDLVWAALAAAGVVLLVLTGFAWSGDPAGIGFAAAASLCWGAYIVLTQRVARLFTGFQGLAVSIAAAAVVAAPVGLGQLRTHLAWPVAAAVALGALVPVLPYGLEVLALRRMSTRAFGILMSVDPAVSALVGWLLLDQHLGTRKLVGIALVVAASLGATTGRGRDA